MAFCSRQSLDVGFWGHQDVEVDAGCLELTVPTRSLHSRGLHVEVKNRGDFPLTATVFSACFCSLFFLKDTDQL